jgi:hypothetical protein
VWRGYEGTGGAGGMEGAYYGMVNVVHNRKNWWYINCCVFYLGFSSYIYILTRMKEKPKKNKSSRKLE